MRRRIGTIIASAALLLGAAGVGANAEYDIYHGDDSVTTRVHAWTENNLRTVKLRDTAADGRWVRTQWLQRNHGTTVYPLDNKSGANTTVSKAASTSVSDMNACFSGSGLQPMQCTKKF